MRWLLEVLANRLSVRHRGWTPSGLAVMAAHPLHLTARGHCPCTGSGQSRDLVPQPAQSQGQSRQWHHPDQHLLSFPPLLGQVALEEGYSRQAGGEALKMSAVQPNRAHLPEPTPIPSWNAGFHSKSSSFRLMLFSRVCLQGTESLDRHLLPHLAGQFNALTPSPCYSSPQSRTGQVPHLAPSHSQ